jgi:hypothetical protein
VKIKKDIQLLSDKLKVQQQTMDELGEMQELLLQSFKPYIDTAMNVISDKKKLADSLKQITIEAEAKILEVINTAQTNLE